ncbi:MAG TPA: anthrone oxygenase family protein [Pseudonocardia sp.]|uniref:anthrone oxygenase family protein n=1 Tax=Pseudonocardia sp. TaxID=60912 RepID=UPI002F41E125
MGTAVQMLTVLGLLGSALVAGIFYAFSSFVMPALGRLPADQGIAAMQSMNITAIRPAFMSVMFGTALVCVVLITCAVRGWSSGYAVPLLVGSLLYLAGVIVLTIAFHVPLNDSLAVLDPAAAGSAGQWAGYLSRWGAGNQLRWVTPLAASACYTYALLR